MFSAIHKARLQTNKEEGSEMNPFCPKHDENPPLLKRQHGGRRSYWVCPKGHKFRVGDELKHQR
jgi:hypothetical protein